VEEQLAQASLQKLLSNERTKATGCGNKR